MNAAHGFCRCASGVKPASGRRIDGARNFALRNRVGPPVLGVRHRYGSQEGGRVGMNGILEYFLQGSHFNDLSQIHDSHSITDILARCQVMGNEKVGEVEFLLELYHQLQDHGPHRDVRHGNRFIGHHELGVRHQCTGNYNSLPLASGELMGILPVKKRGRG